MLNWYIVLFVSLFTCSSFSAEVEGVSFKIHHHYVGLRAAGMGDAFVAVANDYQALFYNPAGLARLDDGELNLSLDVQGSVGIANFYNELKLASSTGTETEKQSAVANAIQNQYGKTFSLRLTPASAFYVRPHIGLAFIPLDLSIEMSPHLGVGPSVNATTYIDSTFAIAYADKIKSIGSGKLSWGLTGKLINRGFFSKSINFIEYAANPSLVKSTDFREGFGVDADLGFLYSPALPRYGFLSLLTYARPTFGLVIRNVMESKMSSSFKLINKELTTAPEKLYRVIDIGTKWEYPSFWLFGGRGVMDFRDIMHPAYTFKKGFHLGFEFDWSVASWWKGAYRVGYSQGYLTAGVSAMFALFNLDLATYSEDVGTKNTPVENRIYAMKLNFNW